MKIGIIGGGFTGLSAAYELSKLGHAVKVYEKNPQLGGLASGYKQKDWSWPLEYSYHHFFANDSIGLKLAKEIDQKVIIKRPKTSVLINGKMYQLDSISSFLKLPLLNPFEKIRMGLTLGFLKLNIFWKPLDKYKAEEVLPKLMGKKGFQLIWHPLFVAKFGQFVNEVSLAWFWARIKKRTSSLVYPEKGYLSFAENLKKAIEKNGGKVYLNAEVKQIKSGDVLEIKKENKESEEKFDKVIVTVPSSIFETICSDLPKLYKEKIESLKSLGATNLILRLKDRFLEDGTYWLNVCEQDSPLMAVVEHTNFMDSKNYNNEHLVYIGHYVPINHRFFSEKKEDLLKEFDPYLKKLNKDYKKNLIDYDFFRVPFAQPIMTVEYSKKILPFKTPYANIFLANMDQIFPWDRGVNYAIELGQKIAAYLNKN
jgi:protoporphyrinogen oxidase